MNCFGGITYHVYESDMEFVTSGTCVKYSWALVNFSRIDAKNTLPLKFQARFFTKLTGVTTKPLILYVENRAA